MMRVTLMSTTLAFASPRLALSGYVLDDSSIRTAVDAWLSNPAAAEATYGHISTWATGGVTDMEYLFCADTDSSSGLCNAGAASFNEDISGWDTSEVTDMAYMFREASVFNQPIGGWVVDKVTDMQWMFKYASSFDQDISNWSVSKVDDMSDMFKYATSFNQPLGNWQVDQVTDMNDIFKDASAFDQDLGWCVDDGVKMGGAFYNTPCKSTSCGVTRKNEFDECEAIVDDDDYDIVFDFGGDDDRDDDDDDFDDDDDGLNALFGNHAATTRSAALAALVLGAALA